MRVSYSTTYLMKFHEIFIIALTLYYPFMTDMNNMTIMNYIAYTSLIITSLLIFLARGYIAWTEKKSRH